MIFSFAKNHPKFNRRDGVKNEDKKIKESDIQELIKSINDLKAISKDIYVCGTSIFRSLDETEKNDFLNRFKTETGYDFNIISQEKESELTVFGTTRFVKDKVKNIQI